MKLMEIAFMEELNISENKLLTILRQNVGTKKLNNVLLSKFKNWIRINLKELFEEEKRGRLLDVWLDDMARYFSQQGY